MTDTPSPIRAKASSQRISRGLTGPGPLVPSSPRWNFERFFLRAPVRPSDHHGSRNNDTRSAQRRHGEVQAHRTIRPTPGAGGHTEREEIAP